MAIHRSAIIDASAQLHDTVNVGPNCVIDGNVRIGPRCRLYQGVYVTGWTQIEADCVLHPGAIVGHEPQDTKYGGERSYCRVGRGTILREYVTVHRGTIPESETVIGEDCFLLAGSHVGHNCRVGNRVTLINAALLAGHVEVHDGAILSGGAAVHQFVRIGQLVMVSGLARVTMDLIPFSLVDPEGRVVGLNRVGLRRAGFPSDQIRDLRLAYRTLFGQGVPFRQATEQIVESAESPLVRRLADFLVADSRRGIAGAARDAVGGTCKTDNPE